MGRKVNPIGFRLGVIRDWQSKWYDEAGYSDNVYEDYKLRKAIMEKYPDASISRIEIERNATKVSVLIHTARPGNGLICSFAALILHEATTHYGLARLWELLHLHDHVCI